MTLQSEQINELMGALAKAQGEMSHAVKDSVNPHFKSKFADLASVWQACRDPLAKNGLAITQTMDFSGERQVLVTTLGHASGQWIKSIVALPIQKPGAQELGSCLSYCRRYALASMVGVYQDDDDAEVATKREPVKGPRITSKQLDEIHEWLLDFPDSAKALCDKFGIQEIAELEQKDFAFVISVFEKRKKAKEKA
jgi:hypothetical protein